MLVVDFIHKLSNNTEKPTKILIVFHSRYGNTARMAEEIAYGAKELSNIQVTIRRIADNVPMEIISKDSAWTKIAEDMNDRYPQIAAKQLARITYLSDDAFLELFLNSLRIRSGTA